MHSPTNAREGVGTFLRTCSVMRFVTLVFDYTLPAEAGRICDQICDKICDKNVPRFVPRFCQGARPILTTCLTILRLSIPNASALELILGSEQELPVGSAAGRAGRLPGVSKKNCFRDIHHVRPTLSFLSELINLTLI